VTVTSSGAQITNSTKDFGNQQLPVAADQDRLLALEIQRADRANIYRYDCDCNGKTDVVDFESEAIKLTYGANELAAMQSEELRYRQLKTQQMQQLTDMRHSSHLIGNKASCNTRSGSAKTPKKSSNCGVC